MDLEKLQEGVPEAQDKLATWHKIKENRAQMLSETKELEGKLHNILGSLTEIADPLKNRNHGSYKTVVLKRVTDEQGNAVGEISVLVTMLTEKQEGRYEPRTDTNRAIDGFDLVYVFFEATETYPPATNVLSRESTIWNNNEPDSHNRVTRPPSIGNDSGECDNAKTQLEQYRTNYLDKRTAQVAALEESLVMIQAALENPELNPPALPPQNATTPAR